MGVNRRDEILRDENDVSFDLPAPSGGKDSSPRAVIVPRREYPEPPRNRLQDLSPSVSIRIVDALEIIQIQNINAKLDMPFWPVPIPVPVDVNSARSTGQSRHRRRHASRVSFALAR